MNIVLWREKLGSTDRITGRKRVKLGPTVGLLTAAPVIFLWIAYMFHRRSQMWEPNPQALASPHATKMQMFEEENEYKLLIFICILYQYYWWNVYFYTPTVKL